MHPHAIFLALLLLADQPVVPDKPCLNLHACVRACRRNPESTKCEEGCWVVYRKAANPEPWSFACVIRPRSVQRKK